jgi:uncharacterized membrane protein (UPF0182 family)
MVLVAGRAASGWYVEYLWYASADALSVWRARTADLALLRGSTFGLAFTILAANFYAVRHSIRSVVFPRRIGNLEFPLEVPGGALTLLAFLAAGILAAVIASLPGEWVGLEMIRSGLRFGESDPFFGLDIGTWLFRIPLEKAVHRLSFFLLIATLLLVVLLYALTPSLRWEGSRLAVSTYARRHLGVLLALFLLLLSWRYRLAAYEVLWQGSGPEGGLTAADHSFRLPATLVMSVAYLASAFLVLFTMWTGQTRGTIFVLGLTFLAAVSTNYVAPLLAGRFFLARSPEDRDRPYLETRRLYTARAFGMRRIARLDPEQVLPSLPDAAHGVPLWDRAALRRAAEHTGRGIALVGGVGFATVQGTLTAFGARLAPATAGGDTSLRWEIWRYAVDRTDESGRLLPVSLSDEPDPAPLPLVNVHEAAASYYVLSDSAAQVQAVSLSPTLVRLAHAWYLRNPRLLGRSGREVRIMLHRDLRERLRRLYPCFVQGSEVTPVVWQDSLYWAVHLYSASPWYPLSASFAMGGQRFSYLAHAAVAVVNSHSAVTYAIMSPRMDSIAALCARRFGQLFRQLDEVDPSLLERLPPAEDLFAVVARAATVTGIEGLGISLQSAPLDGDSAVGSAQLTPFANVRSGAIWLAQGVLDRSTGQLLGILVLGEGVPVVRWIPVREIFHYRELQERLRIARDSLLGILGAARPTRGALRLVPVSGSVLALQTHYALHSDGSLSPAYVAVMHQGKVATGSTIAGALHLPERAEPEGSLSAEAFKTRVQALYEAMSEALRKADWAAFGAAYHALGRLLRAVR